MEQQSGAKAKLPSLRGRIVLFTMGTALLSLVVCIAVLLLLIQNILGGYIQNDVDFAMKEISANMNIKTVFLEDILLQLRDDSVLMNAMDGPGLEMGDDSPTEAALRRVANLYSSKNTDMLDGPFLDQVYLFDLNGSFNRTTYIDYLSDTQEALDQKYQSIWTAFIAKDADALASYQDGHVMIAYRVYDQRMRSVGTILFAIKDSAIQQIMQKTTQYQNSFWVVHNWQGEPVLSSGASVPDAERIARYVSKDHLSPYRDNTGAEDYRVYSESMSMGLGVTIGVASNQLSFLLYDSVKYYLFVPAVLMILLGMALFWGMLRLTRPLSEVADSLRNVADKNFEVKLPPYGNQEFRTISDTFNSMMDTINHLIKDVYERKIVAMDSEIRFLQSQMNPHFLYNVLNTIAIKAKLEGNEEIYRMASNFSGLTQARLYHRDDDRISLDEELQLVRFYLELQKSRFEDRLTYHILVQNDGLLRCRLPKLIVEFIVENAVVHGIEPKPGPGTVYVDVAAEAGDLVVRVEDDGVGFSVDTTTPLPTEPGGGGTHNHVALENARKIIHLYYGEPYGITIQSRREVGTMVTVRIPIDKEEQADVSNFSGGR